jgi:hypothetical protein
LPLYCIIMNFLSSSGWSYPTDNIVAENRRECFSQITNSDEYTILVLSPKYRVFDFHSGLRIFNIYSLKNDCGGSVSGFGSGLGFGSGPGFETPQC